MYYRGYGYGNKGMCPYCGGMHAPGQCPMMMMPPAMPMPSVPMPGPAPMPTPYMEEHMMQVMKLLQGILACCQDTQKMVKEIYLYTAKG